MFLWTDIAHFSYLAAKGHLACFSFLAAMNKDGMDIHVHVAMWTCSFIPLGITAKEWNHLVTWLT